MKQIDYETFMQYDLGNGRHTYDLVIKYDDRQIYRVRDESHTLPGCTFNTEQLNEAIIAVYRISAFSRGRELFLGEPSTMKGAEYIDLQRGNDRFYSSSAGGFVSRAGRARTSTFLKIKLLGRP